MTRVKSGDAEELVHQLLGKKHEADSEEQSSHTVDLSSLRRLMSMICRTAVLPVGLCSISGIVIGSCLMRDARHRLIVSLRG